MNLAISLALAFLGGYVGMKTRLPAGTMLGAALAVIIYKILLVPNIHFPRNLTFISQVLVGVMIAESYNGELLGQLRHLLLPMAISCLVLAAAGILTAVVYYKLGLMDFHTAYVATSPGAMNVLVAMSGDMQANAALVAAFHTVRIILISATAPIIFKMFIKI